MAQPQEQARREFEMAISALEQKRKSRIFSVVQAGQHHLCAPVLGAILDSGPRTGNVATLEMLIHSPGGHADIAYRLVRFLRGRCARLNALVPLQAKSAATLLCLGADSIIMGELAELGPLDVQIGDDLERGRRPFSPLNEFKSMEYLRDYATEFLDFFSLLLFERGMSVKQALHEAIPGVTGIMGPLYAHIDPGKLGSYKRALSEGEEYAKRLLTALKNKKADEIVQELVWNYPSHDFVIDRAEVASLGLPVEEMDAADETLLTDALIGMETYGLAYSGFLPKQPKKRSQRRPRRAKVPRLVKGSGKTATG